MSDYPPADLLAHFIEMKRYVRFDDADGELLRELGVHAEPHFDSIARAFYERAREHEDAHAVFENETQIARLHESLIGWLKRVLSGPYDQAYAQKSAIIGEVHVRVGLPMRYMFTAMTRFRERLIELASEHMADRSVAVSKALARILDVELAMMVESYRRAQLRRIHQIEERRSAEVASIVGERYMQAFDLAAAMLIGLGEDGRVLAFNAEAERLTGYSADEVYGKPFAEVLIDDDESCDFIDAWEAVAVNRRADLKHASCVIRTRHGKRREIAGRIASAATADGQAFFVLSGRDVTHENLLAARLRRSENLASVGTLAAGLAHEIRNPLNGAQLHLTFLSRALHRAKQNGDLREAVEVVSSEIARLSALVNEFLDFARPSRLTRTSSSMKDVAQKALQVAGNGCIQVDFPDSEIIAEIDEDRVEQVLINLLQNAVDASAQVDDGEVHLRLRREPRAVVIEIQDNGRGIPPNEPVFDAFYSTKSGGTGLGLAIAHRIVDDHGGRITLESAPGLTVFRVWLPLIVPERPLSTPPGVKS